MLTNKKTILLVEDEAIIALTEKLSLEKHGYAVQTVTTGEKAVEAIRTVPEIDLVLMDINLGDGIDGTQAAEIILKENDIPIIFVSSHSEREIVEKTEKISSYGYVVKNSSTTVLDVSIKMAFKLFYSNKELSRTKNQLKATLNAIPDLMMIVDREGHFKDFHQPDTDSIALALPPENIIGGHISDIFPSDEVAKHLALYRLCIDTGKVQTHSYSLEIDGVLHVFRMQLAKLNDDQIVAIVNDKTEQRRLQEEQQINADRLSIACHAGGLVYGNMILLAIPFFGMIKYMLFSELLQIHSAVQKRHGLL